MNTPSRVSSFSENFANENGILDLRGDPEIVKNLEWNGENWVDDRFWGWQCVEISGDAINQLLEQDTVGVQM